MKHYTEKRLEDHLESRLLAGGYRAAHYSAFDRHRCLLPEDALDFVKATQPKQYQKLVDAYGSDADRKLLDRLSEEIGKRGVVYVLRNPVKDIRGGAFSMVYFEPKSGLNPEHGEWYRQNRFTLVRQLHFSKNNEQSIDVALCVNGIPIITIELKNHFTGQTVEDAQKQCNRRNHKELIFQFRRCLAHFCVDNDRVFMATRLSENTRWLPYNKDIVNPISEDGHRVQYFWDEILQRESLLDIIENFVMMVQEGKVAFDKYKGKMVETKFDVLIFPRYHQLDAIRKIRAGVVQHGVGKNFLVQHTTGAGKSYEIGWLAHLLASLYRSRQATERIFDSIIVLTDRTVLDKQLQKTIKSLEQTQGVVNPVDQTSKQLREYLERGKDIIISTIQKFPVISNAIGELRSRNFAIIIDEVHSSQSGDTSKHVKKALTKGIVDIDLQEDEDYDDFDSRLLEEIRARGKQPNISYFGFTGTPKGKTLELFGEKTVDAGGKVRFVPFHTYTMRQSIAEGFTLDVLANYCTYERYFKLFKKIEDDREVPKSKVTRQLVNYVDLQPHTIREKLRVMLDHFTEHTEKKIGGRARAMVVTRSRLHCVQTLSRLNRTMSGKTDTFVLDFVNEPDHILAAFQDYFQSTYLEGETEPNRLYDLEREIKGFHLFTEYEVDEFIKIFYNDDIPDEKLMPIIERVIDRYVAIEEEAQKDLFKSKVQSYLRLYSYIAQIVAFEDIGLEKLYIFLNYLNKKLPRRQQEDIADILNAVDLDSFRLAKIWEGSIQLQAADGVMEPLSTGEAAGRRGGGKRFAFRNYQSAERHLRRGIDRRTPTALSQCGQTHGEKRSGSKRLRGRQFRGQPPVYF